MLYIDEKKFKNKKTVIKLITTVFIFSIIFSMRTKSHIR
jgi:hypothetical protein